MPAEKSKIVFFGTPEFALPALTALIESSFADVALVVTQPDKPVGRHHSRLVASPVKKLAQEAGIKVCGGDIKGLRVNSNSSPTPPNPPSTFAKAMADRSGRGGTTTPSSSPADSAGRQEEGRCGDLTDVDLGIVVAYGQILPQKVLDSFPLGVLNIHPSLLPKYRGPSPIPAAILNRDKETGVTIIKLDDKMDHGPIVAREKIKLTRTETAEELHNKLAKTGADLLLKILPDYIAGKIRLLEQEHSQATYTEKLTKESGGINWSKSPDGIEALVRAMNPWPGAWTTWKDRHLIVRQVVLSANGSLRFEEVQLEGKKKMTFAEFLKGHPDFELSDCF